MPVHPNVPPNCPVLLFLQTKGASLITLIYRFHEEKEALIERKKKEKAIKKEGRKERKKRK
jgi:hypothetical protein